MQNLHWSNIHYIGRVLIDLICSFTDGSFRMGPYENAFWEFSAAIPSGLWKKLEARLSALTSSKWYIHGFSNITVSLTSCVCFCHVKKHSVNCLQWARSWIYCFLSRSILLKVLFVGFVFLLCFLTLQLPRVADVWRASHFTSQARSTLSMLCCHNHCNLELNSFHLDWLLSALGTVRTEAGMGLMGLHQVMFQVGFQTLMPIHAVIIALCFISGPTGTESHRPTSTWSRGSILPLWYVWRPAVCC